MERDFELFGLAHWTVLLLTLSIPALLIVWVKRAKTIRLEKGICYTLASLLIVNKLCQLGWTWVHGELSWATGLPMHFCDWATGFVVLALIFRWKWAYELAYFWALSGTAQGLITPDLSYTFPHFRFIAFFISHSGMVIAVLFMTLGLGMRPYWSSLLRAFLGAQIYLVAAWLVNLLINGNYGYLMGKPLNPSLLDHLGPWPWYILTMEGLSLVFFLFYYLPFVIWDGTKRFFKTT
ncbi:MAG: TIGR02206 family membrane protein [Verrucomicrobiota bacterium]